MKTLRIALATVIFLLAPGPQAVSVFAQTVSPAAAQARAAVPVAPVGIAPVGGGALSVSVANQPFAPGLVTPSLVPVAQSPIGVSPAALPVSAAIAAGRSTVRTAVAEAKLQSARIASFKNAGIAAPETRSESPASALKTDRQVLGTTVARIGKADSVGEKHSLLAEVFAGARRANADDSSEVAGKESSESSRLEASSGLEAALAKQAALAKPAALAEPSIPAPSAPQRSKVAAVLRWALPIVAMTALVVGLDFGTKFLAAKYLFTVFHECAWRVPVMKFIIPYIMVTASIARNSLQRAHGVWRWSPKQVHNGRFGFYKEKVSGTDEMAAEHPWMRWAVRL